MVNLTENSNWPTGYNSELQLAWRLNLSSKVYNFFSSIFAGWLTLFMQSYKHTRSLLHLISWIDDRRMK